MTLPTSDAQPSKFLPRRPRIIPQSHSIPVILEGTSTVPFPPTPSSATGYDDEMHYGHSFDFAAHSLDLATGGLKTLTAKRELPMRQDRRLPDTLPDARSATHSYSLLLVVLSCITLILIGGGITLFAMLQP